MSESTARTELKGIGVSAGTAAGPIAVVTPAVGIDQHEPASVDPESDGVRVREALDEVAASLRSRAEHANSETSKAVLEATATLATDKGLIKGIDKELKKGSGVTKAIHDAVETYASKLRKLGGYMAERVTDLYDIRDRATARVPISPNRRFSLPRIWRLRRRRPSTRRASWALLRKPAARPRTLRSSRPSWASLLPYRSKALLTQR